jgi:hypothetical protein
MLFRNSFKFQPYYNVLEIVHDTDTMLASQQRSRCGGEAESSKRGWSDRRLCAGDGYLGPRFRQGSTKIELNILFVTSIPLPLAYVKSVGKILVGNKNGRNRILT